MRNFFHWISENGDLIWAMIKIVLVILFVFGFFGVIAVFVGR